MEERRKAYLFSNKTKYSSLVIPAVLRLFLIIDTGTFIIGWNYDGPQYARFCVRAVAPFLSCESKPCREENFFQLSPMR